MNEHNPSLLTHRSLYEELMRFSDFLEQSPNTRRFSYGSKCLTICFRRNLMSQATFKRVLFIAMLALAAMAVALPATMAQDAPPANTVNTITVTGVGEASAAPDMATVIVGVELSGTDITAVYSEVNTSVANIKTALEGIGIDAGDISTANLSMYANSIPMGEGLPPQNETRVGNTLNIVVRDLSQIESVIDTAVGAGANAVYGLTFDISDKSALEAEARTNALADANDRAGQLATGINVTLGDVVSIVEFSGGYGYPMPYAEQAFGGGGGAVIEPGQFTYSLQVTVTYSFSR
jgi:hypothetical protein